MRNKLAFAFAIAAAVACSAGVAYAADGPSQDVTFSLKYIASGDAATVLRAIAGVKSLDAASEHTLSVRDSAANLGLAATVVNWLDTADEAARATSFSAGDGSVVAFVVLNRVLSREVMVALRKEVRIARIATVGEKRVVLRDTASQIEAARKVIESLERGRAHP